jgi:hypothetical protein
MTDFTKCDNKKCPMKDTCKRWVAKPDPVRQSYATFYPYQGKCGFYIKVK